MSAMSERDSLFPQCHDLWRNLSKSMRSLPHVRHRQRQWSAIEYSVTRVLHQVLEQETAFVNLPRSTLG